MGTLRGVTHMYKSAPVGAVDSGWGKFKFTQLAGCWQPIDSMGYASAELSEVKVMNLPVRPIERISRPAFTESRGLLAFAAPGIVTRIHLHDRRGRSLTP